MKKHLTIRDVAKSANVSTKTVSRVINDQGEISETTRQRVQEAIEALGYRPNIMARNLASGRSDTLAVVAWGLEYYGPSRVVVGVEQRSDELGYSLLLNLRCKPDDNAVDSVLDALTARRVGGIIWAIPEIGNNRDWIQPNRLQQLPPIVFLSMEPRPGLPVVAVDNQRGATQATQHLIDHGRRRIGLIAGPLNWWEARERQEGWRNTLVQAGLTASPSMVVEGDWSSDSGERAMRILLTKQPDIDAIFACNDQMALGALCAAHQLGRAVPQDVAIVGFDNIPESAHFWPPLTSVNQRLVDAGRVAVDTLHKLVEARRHEQDDGELGAIMLKPDLVIRQSSGKSR
jgi:DNA-binding LacI/PurR family transcriptional regulator